MTPEDKPSARPAADPPRDAAATPDGEAQRDALMDAERKAAEQQPDSFMERAVTDKVVGIPPVDGTDRPIEGLDPKPK